MNTKKIGILLFFLFPQIAFAWGNRGHGLICEAAIHLLQENSLKYSLKLRTTLMTHVCNIPDTLWRRIDTSPKSAATHYIHSDHEFIIKNPMKSNYLESFSSWKTLYPDQNPIMLGS
ncbi:MAG: hypothetical protein K2Q18_19405, partial [Bdellovibrionales bacterium]|nr:hypothetical protein [Bdellovibrionales bacterium]